MNITPEAAALLRKLEETIEDFSDDMSGTAYGVISDCLDELEAALQGDDRYTLTDAGKAHLAGEK